ncbi:MAG: LytTR family transcriptional regulator [Bacteroidia bacterium]|nr:LytTR family transcriptional regulator [Bacteroidia bacterium]
MKKNYQRIDPKVQKLKSAIDRYKRYADNNSGNDPVQTLLEKHQKPGDSTPDIYIPIKSGIQKTKPERIIICATGGKGITIHLMGNESITISKTLNWLEERLESYGFFRVHNSYLVNLEHVKKIIHVREGAEITLSNGKLAEVSKRKKAQFLDVLSRQNRLNIL